MCINYKRVCFLRNILQKIGVYREIFFDTLSSAGGITSCVAFRFKVPLSITF
jgi:hypothetical protein